MNASHVLLEERTLTRAEIIARIRERLLAARDDLAGIILFGSFARADEWNDIDVLVVLRDPIPNRSAWNTIMLECQDAIGFYNLDLIPTHLEGLRAGLADHVFILMNAAFDGVVIYGEETLQPLLEHARQEIIARGIRRTETGGWRFPVRYRQRTTLSPRDNAERAKRWLEEARRELEIGDQLRSSSYFDRCVYHCQQSIERSVKAVLICFGAFESVHWVGKILENEVASQDVGSWRERLLRLAGASRDIEHASTDARYIIENENEDTVWIPSEHYFEPEAAASLASARNALTTAQDFIVWWFEPDEQTTEEK